MRSSCIFALLMLVTPVTFGQDAKEFRFIETIDAWEDAGAEVGWMKMNDQGAYEFLRKPAEGAVEAYRFKHWKEGMLAKLPAPNAAFGLDLEQTSITDDGLKELRPFRHLTVINLAGRPITDLGVKTLAEMPQLTGLSLAKTKITDDDMVAIGKLTNLRYLSLANTAISDAHAKQLGSLHQLVTVDLSLTKITDAGLKHLSAGKGLNNLILADSQVTNKVLKTLREMSLLHAVPQAKGSDTKRPRSVLDVVSLDLRRTSVIDDGFLQLAPLQSLALLEASETQLTDQTLQSLRKIGLLHTLSAAKGVYRRPRNAAEVVSFSLMDTPVTDLGLNEVVDFQYLQSLNLSGTGVTHKGIKSLAVLKHLKKLDLGKQWPSNEMIKALIDSNLLDCVLTPEGVEGRYLRSLYNENQYINLTSTNAGDDDLWNFKHPVIIDLSATKVTDKGLPTLRNYGLTLRALSLTGTSITDAGLKEIRQLRLRSLSLWGTKLTDAGLVHLNVIRDLAVLDLRNTSITDKGISSLKLEDLEVLRLSGTSISDWGLESIAELKKLKEVTLLRTKVTAKGVEKLKRALPECDVIAPMTFPAYPK